MTETKTETLADILRSLSELAPERFYRDKHYGPRFFLKLNGKSVFEAERRTVEWEACVLAACMEECEARGWSWDIASYDPGEYGATIQDPRDEWRVIIQTGEFLDSAALALATALRDALEASL